MKFFKIVQDAVYAQGIILLILQKCLPSLNIIIGHILNKNMLNYYLFYIIFYVSELYITLQVIYIINICFLLEFCWQPINGFNTSTNWLWLENIFFYIERMILKISIWNCVSSLISTHFSTFLFTCLLDLAKA